MFVTGELADPNLDSRFTDFEALFCWIADTIVDAIQTDLSIESLKLYTSAVPIKFTATPLGSYFQKYDALHLNWRNSI